MFGRRFESAHLHQQYVRLTMPCTPPSFDSTFRVHISMELSRYAPLTLNMRLQRHHQGAYLHGNAEICAAHPQYAAPEASSGYISPRKCRDMRRLPSIYGSRGIIRVHISTKMLRYAPPALNMRLQRHYRGAYLHEIPG